MARASISIRVRESDKLVLTQQVGNLPDFLAADYTTPSDILRLLIQVMAYQPKAFWAAIFQLGYFQDPLKDPDQSQRLDDLIL